MLAGFWRLGPGFGGTNWLDWGEIDIMEFAGREPNLIIGTLHSPGYSGVLGLSQWNRQEYNIPDEFHTYAVEWEQDTTRWYFDGTHYFTVNCQDVGNRKWAFAQPFLSF